MVLGLVRAAQGRDEEAELLLREAIDALSESDYRNVEPEPLAAYAGFLRERGRDALTAKHRVPHRRPQQARRVIQIGKHNRHRFGRRRRRRRR